jgi:hypothetical protein
MNPVRLPVNGGSACPYTFDAGFGVTDALAWFTVTFTDPVTELYAVVLPGVKVTLCAAVPAGGSTLGEVKLKVPETVLEPAEAEPPLSVEEVSV